MKSDADKLGVTSTEWRIGLLSATLVLAQAGCVAQSTYDKQLAETADLKQSLTQAQLEVNEVAKQVTALQTSNRELDAMTDELRAAVQREEDALSAFRQKSRDRIAALQTQIASLINQGRALSREIADAKQHNASLRASAAQLKRELEEIQEQPPASTGMPGAVPGPGISLPTGQNQTTLTAQPTSQQQTAQALPAAPVPSGAASPGQPDPAPADETWAGWFLNWLSTLWSWIFE